MWFKRNKTVRLISIAIVIFLLVGSGLYVYLSRVSADQVSTSLLADQQDQPNPNDPTVIRLPAKYSKDQIKSAQTKQISQNPSVISTQSAVEKQINSYIDNKTKELAKSLPLKQGTKDKPAMNDLIFKVADNSGHIIYPTTTTNTASIETVADNFSFDSSVPNETKSLMIQAYPVIESFYGPRADTDPIKVLRDKSLGRAYFSGVGGIHLDNSNSKDTQIHELVHAFHNRYCYNSLWEEGFAVKITTLVEKQMNLSESESYIIQDGYSQGIENLPSIYDPGVYEAWNPWYSNLPYSVGSATLDKIYMEDREFFKKFNRQLYTIDLTKNYLTMSKMIEIAINSTPTVEGESSWSWFLHQNPYINYYDYGYTKPENSLFFARASSSGLSPLLFRQITDEISLWFTSTVFIRTTENMESGDFDLKLLDQQGKVLVDPSEFNTTSRDWHQIGKTTTTFPKTLNDYSGPVTIEITPVKHPEDRKTQEFLKVGNRSENDIYISSKSGTKAIFSGKDSRDSASVTKTNGYFALKADWIRKAGRYKVEIYDSSNKKINEKYFNKTEMSDYYLFLGDTNVCKNTINNVKSLNRSFSLTSATAENCAHILSIAKFSLTNVKKIPLYRYWGKTFSPVISDLAKSTLFGYQINTASDTSKVRVKSGSTRTSSSADFLVTKAENFGDPAKNTFYRRVSFNIPYNPETVNLTMSAGGGGMGGGTEYPAKVTIRKVNNTTFDIIPDHVYNNAYYYISGLDKVTDVSGNPIYKFNWDLARFETPVNPAGSSEPGYVIGSNSYNPNDKIIVTKNFKSIDLTNHLLDINLWRDTDKGECAVDDFTCGKGEVSATVVGDQIIIVPKKPMISGKNYWLFLPSVIDDSNNFVSQGTYLSFSVK